MNYRHAANEISEKSGVSLRPAPPDMLRALMELEPPESLVAFYREFEPEVDAEIGKVRLPCIDSIVLENTEAVPGADLRPHGFMTFATTIYGDAYCFDAGPAGRSDAPVVIMTHEVAFRWSPSRGHHVGPQDRCDGLR